MPIERTISNYTCLTCPVIRSRKDHHLSDESHAAGDCQARSLLVTEWTTGHSTWLAWMPDNQASAAKLLESSATRFNLLFVTRVNLLCMLNICLWQMMALILWFQLGLFDCTDSQTQLLSILRTIFLPHVTHSRDELKWPCKKVRRKTNECFRFFWLHSLPVRIWGQQFKFERTKTERQSWLYF